PTLFPYTTLFRSHAGDLVRASHQGRCEGGQLRAVRLRCRGQAGSREGGRRRPRVPHCTDGWEWPAGRPAGGLQQTQVDELLRHLHPRQRPPPDRRQLTGTMCPGVQLPGLQGRRVTPAPHAILIPMLREKGELMTSPTRFLDLNTARELAEALAASGQEADARLVLRSIDRIEEQARFLRHVGQSAVAEGVWEPEVPVSE